MVSETEVAQLAATYMRDAQRAVTDSEQMLKRYFQRFRFENGNVVGFAVDATNGEMSPDKWLSSEIEGFSRATSLLAKRRASLFEGFDTKPWDTFREVVLAVEFTIWYHGVNPNSLGQDACAAIDRSFKDVFHSARNLKELVELWVLSDRNPDPKKPGSDTDPKASAGRSQSKARKKKGSQTPKLVAYLTKHHDYGSCHVGNYHPAESKHIARESQTKPNTVSDFFKREFPASASPRDGYVGACRNKATLLLWFIRKHDDNLPVRTADVDSYGGETIRDK